KKNRWLDVIAFRKLRCASATNSQLGFLLADILIGTHPLILLFAHQRPHLSIALKRRAERDLFRLFRHRINKLLVNRLLHQDAAAGGANFSLIDEYSEQRAIDGSFEVRIGKENILRLPAKLKSHALYRVRSLLDDDLAHRRATGERDFVDVRVLHQWRATALSEASDDIHHSRRQPHVGKPGGHFERSKRSLFRRLQDTSATCGKRRRQFPSCHHQRIVPRDYLSRNADRLLQRETHGVIRNGI